MVYTVNEALPWATNQGNPMRKALLSSIPFYKGQFKALELGHNFQKIAELIRGGAMIQNQDHLKPKPFA